MLFYILALLPFLPLYLAAPKAYNPFPPPSPRLLPRSDHGRAGFTPEMLAAYKTAESTGVTPVYNVMVRGKHYKRGASMLETRAVGQGRRSKVRIVRRAATTCVPITSSTLATTATSSATSSASSSVTPSSSSAAYTSRFNTITPPGVASRSSTSTMATASSSQSVESSAKSSVHTTPSTSTTQSASTSSATSSAQPISSSSTTSSTMVIPSSTRTSTSSKPSPTSVARVTADRGGDGPFSGWGTWFDVGLGACGVWDTPDHPLVAISAELMDNWPGISPGYNPNNHPLCGQHMKITWRGISTLARVADRCPGCAVRSLDMSKGLFEHFATLDVGLLGMDSYTGNITWSWIEGTGSLPSLPFTP